MEARFFTDVGATRTRNEDAGGVFYNHTGQMMLIICDGMGGHNAGDYASQFALEFISSQFTNENYIEFQQAEHWLKSVIAETNRQLFTRASEDAALNGMGTTLVCALMFEEKVILANIGDSRAYFINDREMRQLTNDHTFVNHLVMAGEITKEEAAHHPQRNIITKVLGTDRRVLPDLFSFNYKHYEYMLLSSDGLTDYVDENVVKTIISEEEPMERIGSMLIDTALSNGVRDNVSFVLCRLGGAD